MVDSREHPDDDLGAYALGTLEEPEASRVEAHVATCATCRRVLAEHRAVVVLRYLLDYTPGEISELLDLPRGTVNSRLRRGLDQLEKALRDE